MDEHRHRIFPGRYACIVDAAAFCAQAAEDLGMDQRAVFHVQMAVDEACTNVIRHAYGGEDRGEIQIDCRLEDTTLTVTLTDHGQPFNPDTIPEPPLGADLESRDVGGLGLYFMRQMMDEVRFRFDPHDGNVVVMVKRMQPEDGQRP